MNNYPMRCILWLIAWRYLRIMLSLGVGFVVTKELWAAILGGGLGTKMGYGEVVVYGFIFMAVSGAAWAVHMDRFLTRILSKLLSSNDLIIIYICGSSPHRVGDFGLISYRIEHAGEDFQAQVLLVA
jgi:hypothetical protein